MSHAVVARVLRVTSQVNEYITLNDRPRRYAPPSPSEQDWNLLSQTLNFFKLCLQDKDLHRVYSIYIISICDILATFNAPFMRWNIRNSRVLNFVLYSFRALPRVHIFGPGTNLRSLLVLLSLLLGRLLVCSKN